MNTDNKLFNQAKERRSLIRGLGLLSLFPIFNFGFFSQKNNVISCAPDVKPTTMKMLTQDGRLVEVDISKIKGHKEKVSIKQLQDWVKKEL